MLAFTPATGVNAQQLSIKASADSMQLRMGSKATLHVEVINPAGPGVPVRHRSDRLSEVSTFSNLMSTPPTLATDALSSTSHTPIRHLIPAPRLCP